MAPRHRAFPAWAAAVATTLAAAAASRAQVPDVRPGVTIARPFGAAAPFTLVWDYARQRPFAIRDVLSPSDASIATFDAGGAKLRMLLNPIADIRKDRPRTLDIWGAAAAPDGSVLFAGVVVFPKHQVSHVIATYSSEGVLTKLWDMFPYHHHALDVDALGRVYAFGHSILRPQKPPYPLLIRYTSHGKVDATLLTASDIADYPDPAKLIDDGTNQLVVRNEVAWVLIGAAGELVRIEQQTVKRRKLTAVVEGLWGKSDIMWTARGLVPLDDGVVTEFVGGRVNSAPGTAMSRFVHIGRDFAARQLRLASEVVDAPPKPRLLLGSAAPDVLIFSNSSEKDTVATVTRERLASAPWTRSSK